MLSIFLSQFISLTKLKMSLARYLYKLIRLLKNSDEFKVTRNGINLDLDIREGIDLSIYLLGEFQKHVFDIPFATSRKDLNVIDVGANIGLMSLTFANKYSEGRIFSFEPTDYAVKKFQKNLDLNPQLKDRITIYKAMLAENPSQKRQSEFYSSWKIDNSSKDAHAIHSGTKEAATEIDVVSIDSFVKNEKLVRVDLIKIDTDGSELGILKGAVETIDNFKPIIVFEIGLYLLNERGITFQDYYDFFYSRGYSLKHLIKKKEVNQKNYKWLIPKYGTTDLIAVRNA